MKYPNSCKSVIDVTKAPYFADNTGKKDCTKALRKAIDDCLKDYITGIEETRKELLELAEKQGGGNIYLGAEAARYVNEEVFITFPKKIPPIKSIYFPDGTYLVSDTITYTFDNLSTRQQSDYNCELCRNIHIFGESRENTVIRLADSSTGFEKGNKKPIISFNKASKEDKETTNCAQMNTLEDITVDCGNGNEGAIGILYASSNCGRIENVNVIGNDCFCGIDFDYGSEACVCSIMIKGFDYGMRALNTSPLVLEEIDISKNKTAGILTKNGMINCRNINCGDIPLFSFVSGSRGRFYCDTYPEYIGDDRGVFIFAEDKKCIIKNKTTPQNIRSADFNDWVCVDDFGAVGDGNTDSTIAIQKAMNSGKTIVYFGEGTYKIEKTIKIPSSVKTVDFRYCDIVPGLSMIVGEVEAMFDICEESNDIFFAEKITASEECSGFFRFFRHSAKRDVVIKDVFLSASLYFNTVGGSEVYFDNCFTLTSHYSQDAVLHREGYTPVFCKVIPVEIHGQKVYAKNLNIERADIELLNDNSQLVVDGYKVEGPGVLVKSIGGGKTQLNLFNAAWWGNKIRDNSMFILNDSEIMLKGGNVFGFPDDEEYCLSFLINKNQEEERVYLKDCSVEIKCNDALGRSMGRVMETIFLKK